MVFSTVRGVYMSYFIIAATRRIIVITPKIGAFRAWLAHLEKTPTCDNHQGPGVYYKLLL